MQILNRRAMELPKTQLMDVLEEAIAKKQEIIAQRDRIYGKDRVRIMSGPENLLLPETFGFDMNDYYKNPELALETEIRKRIFWLDNCQDDSNYSMTFPAVASVYYDMTLFGVDIAYTRDGVPNMAEHPFSQNRDLSLLGTFDFNQTGEMPWVISQYEQQQRIAQEQYGGKLSFTFPEFTRGPLDIYVQLRGYENFIMDYYEDPEALKEAIDFIVERRQAYRKARLEYLGQKEDSGFSWICDDWINFPFITEDLFEEIAVPAYQKIQEKEGAVTFFHTCGNMEPIAARMAELFPKLEFLEVSGWNDYDKIDAAVPKARAIRFCSIISEILLGSKEQHRKKLEAVARAAKGRKTELYPASFVRLDPTLEESMFKFNDYMNLAREIFAET